LMDVTLNSPFRDDTARNRADARISIP